MKKRIWLLLAIFSSFISLFFLTSCVSKEENALLEHNIEQFIDAVIAGDSDAAYDMVSPEISRYDFEIEFYNMRSYLEDTDSYVLKRINVYKSVYTVEDTEVTQISSRYRLKAESENLVVDVTTEDLTHFSAIWFTPEELTNLYYTGTPGHMNGASAAQWIFLAFGILTILFTLITLIDCIRRKLRMKVLWIFLILLATLLIQFSYANGFFNLNFRPGIYLGITSLVHYGDGSMSISLVLPLGSILYYIFRKKMIPKSEPSQKMPLSDSEIVPEEDIAQ